MANDNSKNRAARRKAVYADRQLRVTQATRDKGRRNAKAKYRNRCKRKATRALHQLERRAR